MQIIALAIFCAIFAPVFIATHFIFGKRSWRFKSAISLIATIGIIAMTIYGCSPKPIDYSNPELAPMWKAVADIDRASLGFTPVQTNSTIRIERAAGRNYDIMLHIYDHTSRTIAFKKRGDQYFWIGEQETHTGPRQFKTVDGLVNEELTFTYHKENISGYPLNKLNITYWWAETTNDSFIHDLSLDDARKLLKSWGQ